METSVQPNLQLAETEKYPVNCDPSPSAFKPIPSTCSPMSAPSSHISNQLSLMSQINQLSQYKATPVTRSSGRTSRGSKEVESMSTASISMCIPILEPHMSTPMLRSNKAILEYPAPLQNSFEQLQEQVPRRQSVIKMNRR